MPRTERRHFLLGAAAGLGLASGMRCAPWRADASTTPALPSGVRQLFVDDEYIERLDGVRRVLHQPEKFAGNPILRYDQTPWQGFRCQLYGTALRDPADGRIKLWYLAVPRLPFEEPVVVNGRRRVPNFQLVGYAESRDGFHFELPHLGLVDFNGSTANNLCRIGRECVEGIAVVHDADEPDRQRRYKALYWEHRVPLAGAPGIDVNAMCVSFSADGKRWTDYANNPVIPFASDTGQQAIYDPALKKYVAYGRFGVEGRRLARSESANFVDWAPPQPVLEADAEDGPGAQIYGMGVAQYEGLYLGLPWIFHEGTTHQIDVQLATSRDGIQWRRAADRAVFIPNGPADRWDAGIIFTASQPIVAAGDKLLIYYSASAHNHDYRQRPKSGSPEAARYWQSVKTSIGVATLRRDGFISLEPGDSTGRLLTKPFLMPAAIALFVNADAGNGELRLQIIPQAAPDKPCEAAPLRADDCRHRVQWAGDARLPAPGVPVRLELTLTGARLYSYWFE
jgi:hypothetical protein